MPTPLQKRSSVLLLAVLMSILALSFLAESLTGSWSYASMRQPPKPPVVEVTRGAAQSTPTPPPIPTTSIDIMQINWGQIVAMMGVLGGISTVVQWILTRALIQPQIRDAVTSATSDVRVWALTQFPSKSDFDIHSLRDTQAHESITQRFNDLAHDLSQTAERASILHDKVIVLETAGRK
jgi:hypothetical protein